MANPVFVIMQSNYLCDIAELCFYHCRVLTDAVSFRSDRLVHSVLTSQINCVVNVEEPFEVLDSLNYLETMTENFSLGNKYYAGELLTVLLEYI